MTPRWVSPFLDALAAGCTVSDAARAARISSASAYQLRKTDADFAEAWRLALEDGTDLVEAVHRSDAVNGIEELVVYQGQLTPVWEYGSDGQPVQEQYIERYVDKDGNPKGRDAWRNVQARNPDGSLKWLTVRKIDMRAREFILRGRRKEVFGTDRTEITGRDGAPLQVDDVARRARIAAIVAAAQERSKLA